MYLQVVPSLPGRWWNLERSFYFSHKSERHRSVWLFNISEDPFERNDLSDHRPEVVRVLLERLAHYNRSAVPVSFPPTTTGGQIVTYIQISKPNSTDVTDGQTVTDIQINKLNPADDCKWTDRS